MISLLLKPTPLKPSQHEIIWISGDNSEEQWREVRHGRVSLALLLAGALVVGFAISKVNR